MNAEMPNNFHTIVLFHDYDLDFGQDSEHLTSTKELRFKDFSKDHVRRLTY